jgi:glycosyltransferase involved in cell wall biosynthesis
MRLTDLVTPLKPLEAMSMEKIVLGSSVGGITELVEDGVNGFLFKPDEPESISACMLRILEDRETLQEIGPRSRRYVQEHRSWEKIVERYKHVYDAAKRSHAGR